MNSSVAVVVVVVGGSPLAPSINETRDLYRSHGTNGVCRVKVARRVTNEVAYFCVSRTGSASVFSHCSSRLPTQRQHAMWYVCVCVEQQTHRPQTSVQFVGAPFWPTTTTATSTDDKLFFANEID